ncbi:zinc ribbon domain-containing protein [Dactylosporangium sp. AC04546]|uniref:Zn-ribbon domain-containing OB-fold protein n=1 Tax=Dactylosporangium sp. AC04546 TaxID=2862460 RepID=UPI001EDEB8DF|nr:zinc ribbon domain-containing protein [Dactylosporangium sp. AC04546]WVK88250.1 zinc ribbon domain-containing protein [Dactylosporangium sp. AC04546]
MSAPATPAQPSVSAASWRQPRVDRDSAEWWAAVARHELLLQRCDGCDELRWPPRAMCAGCGGFDWTWRPSAGDGTVASWIRSHRAFAPGLPLPHVTVLVRLADQPDLLLPGGWTGTTEPRTGLAARLRFDDIEPGLTLLSWEAA